jgi:hypothetical protein
VVFIETEGLVRVAAVFLARRFDDDDEEEEPLPPPPPPPPPLVSSFTFALLRPWFKRYQREVDDTSTFNAEPGVDVWSSRLLFASSVHTHRPVFE